MNERAPLDDLMRALSGGDPAAAAPLFEGCRRPLFAFLFRMCGSAEVAEDLLQETFLAIHAGRATFGPGRPFLPWAFAVARNRYHEWRRDEAKVIRLAQRACGDAAIAGTPDHAPRAEARHDLRKALSALPEPMREAFLLKHFHGHTYEEIAALQQAPAPTVKSRVLTAIARLRETLGRGA